MLEDAEQHGGLRGVNASSNNSSEGAEAQVEEDLWSEAQIAALQVSA